MEIKKTGIRAIFEKVNKRVAVVVAAFLVLVGAGVTYYFVLADNAISGTNVSISASTKMKYGKNKDKVTYRYIIKYKAGTDSQGNSGAQYEAVCAEPDKNSPKGQSSSVYEMDATTKNEKIKRILLTTRLGKNASIEYNGTTYNAYNNRVFDWTAYTNYTDYSSSKSLSKFDYVGIALGHALAGYVYSGSTQGFGSEFANDYWEGSNGLIQKIWDIFEQDGYKQLAESVTLRRSEGTTASGAYQDLIWLENVPQATEEGQVGITKVIPIEHESLLTDYPDKYTLSGAVFDIYDEGGCTGGTLIETDRVDGLAILEGGACSNPVGTLTTGGDGKTTGVLSLVPGIYYIKERSAPTGFRLNNDIYQTAILDGDTVWLDIEDDPIVGGIMIQKVDSETLQVTPQGGAKLQGSRFRINNLDTMTTVADNLYSAADGTVEYDGLPVGNYQIYETAAAEGYVTPSSSSTTRINFTINSDGSNSRDGEVPKVTNKIKRGDLRFTKKKKSYLGVETVAAGVPFLIQLLDSSGDVIEQHVIVSDDDGVVDTSARRGVRVNANDATFGNDGVALDGTDYSGVRSSSLDKTAGVWFGTGTNGVDNTYRANNGALIYGSYRVVELKIADNMIYVPAGGSDAAFTFNVSENGAVVSGGEGTVVDNLIGNPALGTIASAVEGDSSASSRTSEVEIGESVTIYDYISYSGLIAGRNYKIVAFLTDESGNEVRQNGNVVSGNVSFTAGSGGSGTTKVKLENVDTSKFVGKELTVNEVLYYVIAGSDTIEIGKHLDPNYSGVSNASIEAMSSSENTNQTVKVKTTSITSTTATASDGNSKEMNVGFVQIQDKMTVKGLVNGKSYTIKTWVQDESGNKVTIWSSNGFAGWETVETTISSYSGTTAEDAELTINNIYIDTTDYIGKKLTVYQEISDSDGNKSTHPNSSSSSSEIAKETVTVKTLEIGTVAYDGGGTDESDKEVKISETAKIKDRIHYNNLESGTKYYLTGKVVDENGNEVSHAESNILVEKEATGSSGDWYLDFTVDTRSFVGKSLTIYEYLYASRTDSTPILSHAETMNNDEKTAETVRVAAVSIATEAKNADNTSTKDVGVGTVNIIDYVKYVGLTVGERYRLAASLRKTDGTVIKEAVSEAFTAVADGENNPASVTFYNVDTKSLIGQTLYVTEIVYTGESGGVEVARHEQNVESQRVYVKTPEIGTVAYDGGGTDENDKEIKISENAVVNDKVHYEGLVNDTKYYLTGKVVDVDSGTVLGTVEKKEVIATGESGDWVMTFEHVDTRGHVGKNLIVYEYLYMNSGDGEPAVSHAEEMNAEEKGKETVRVITPEIRTRARNADDTSTQEVGVGTINVIDYVEYTGLTVGDSYWLKASLRKADGTVIKTVQGEKFTAVADGESNSASVTFTGIDTTGLISETLYITEVLYQGESGDETYEIAKHEENVESQRIKVKTPTIETVATGDRENGKEVEVLTDAKVYDKIRVTGLVKGETYKLISQLTRDVEGGEFVEVERAYPTEFTVVNEDGSAEVEVEFTLNTVGLEDKELTALEWAIYGDDKEVVKHTEKTEEQTVRVKKPTLETEAKSGSLVEGNGDKVVALVNEAKIVDTARYTGLADGVSYRAFGILYDQNTGEKLLVKDEDGVEKEVTAEKEFVAKGEGGEVELEFTLEVTSMPGKNIVVFEYIYYKEDEEETEIIKHDDIESTEQWVEVQPRIGTKVIDEVDGDQAVGVGVATVIDTVRYEGLKVGAKYKVKGKMMDRKAGEAVGVEGESEEFVITEEMGTTNDKDITVKFEFDTTEMQGRSLVVFEELYEIIENGEEKEEILRSVHEEIEDEEQWVDVKEARVATTAVDGDDGDKELNFEKEALITDTVEYYGLIKDETYKLVGILMDKATGEGLGVMEKKEFTAEAENGTVQIDFTIDTTEMSGKEIVVFETLYYVGEDEEEEVEIAKHQDLEDSSQTVWVKVKTPNTGMFGSVSDGVAVRKVIYAAVVIGALGAAYAIVNRKRKIRF